MRALACGPRPLGLVSTVPLFLLAVGACAGPALPEPPAPDDLPRLEMEAELRPSDIEAAVQLGRGYRAVDRLDDARRVLERTLRIAPGHDAVSLLLGLTYEDLDRLDDAVGVYGLAIEHNPSTPLGDDLRGRFMLAQRRLLQARIADAVEGEGRFADRAPDPSAVAVFPFEYGGGDERLRSLGRAFAWMLTTDLSQTNRLRVLERIDVQLFLDEIALGASGRVDPATAVRGGTVLGAGNVVHGTISGASSSPLTVRAAVARSGDRPGRLREVEDRDELDALFDLEKRVALDIYESLGIELTVAELERVSRRWTESMEALLSYGHGLEAEARGLFGEAASHFSEAARHDPAFVQAATAADAARLIARAATPSPLGAELTGLEAPDEFDVEQALRDLDALVPTGAERDPLAEVMGWEGSPSLRLLILRPGGS